MHRRYWPLSIPRGPGWSLLKLRVAPFKSAGDPILTFRDLENWEEEMRPTFEPFDGRLRTARSIVDQDTGKQVEAFGQTALVISLGVFRPQAELKFRCLMANMKRPSIAGLHYVKGVEAVLSHVVG